MPNGFEEIAPEEITETKVFNGQVGVVLRIDLKANNGKGMICIYYPDNDYVAIYEKYEILPMMQLIWPMLLLFINLKGVNTRQ